MKKTHRAMFSDKTERNDQKQISLSKIKNQPKIQHKTVVLSALHYFVLQAKQKTLVQTFLIKIDCKRIVSVVTACIG